MVTPNEHGYKNKVEKVGYFSPRSDFHEINIIINTILFASGRSVNFNINLESAVGGAVISWLVRSTPERAARVRALPWNIVLCS